MGDSLMSGLHELIPDNYSAILQEPAFRLTIEAHQRFFLKEGNYELHMVDDHEANKYRFDLNGYLTSQNKAAYLHFATMRQNKMTSPREFTYDRFKALLIPSESAFKTIVKRYQTTLGSAI